MEEQNKKTEKLTDKAFSRLVLMSVFAILICIVGMCSTTYAWFNDGVPSGEIQIKAADSCLLSVTVSSAEEQTALGQITAEAEVQEMELDLEANVPYTVTLSLPSDSASGYCLITAENGDVYHSDYIARHDGELQTVSFTLTVETAQKITFTKRWGIYSDACDVVNGEMLIP